MPDRAAFEAWIEANHASSDGIWLQLAKKDSAETTVSRADALELALCYGWIDGQARTLDDDFWLQRFTPRRSRSRWSQINREAAERLIAAGEMRPPGLAEVERAKADGRWEAAYASPANATVPPDLQARLDAEPEAKAFFETLTSQNRFAILYRIQDAKRPETRARRIEKFVKMLKKGETPH